MVQFDEDKQNLKLAELRLKDEEEFVRTAASNRGIAYFNLAQTPIDADALRLIPETDARAAGMAGFQLLDKQLGVAIVNPDNKNSQTLLHALATQGYSVKTFLVSPKSLERALAAYTELSLTTETKAGSFDISNKEIETLLASVHTIKDIKKLIADVLAQKKHSQTTRMVEIILAGALAVNASDVHIEPEQMQVRLRFRLDGVLNTVLDFEYETYAYVLSRIKLISGLKLNVKAEAQDGRFSINAKNSEIEVRTSVLPGSYGESIVLRVLNPEAISVSMDQLGLETHLREVLEREIAKPNGMILTTGPTGSGKTTTLYAFLKKVHTPEIKIITIEDPVEYHLPGIVQTQTSAEKGYTFSLGLRAALRQDPDIIMVGEIRDSETAEIAINAAATGHLVFSTLHTNNAAGTFPRLINLGVNPKVISSALSLAIAQRLARTLCTYCKKETPLSGTEKSMVEKIMASVTLPEYKNLQQKTVWEPVGCDKCNLTGYKGRIGIFEAIRITPGIEAAVLLNPSEREIQVAASDQGMLTMRQDGIIKVLKGATAISELRRVIDLEENH